MVHLLFLRRALPLDFRSIKSISVRKLVESVLVSQQDDSERTSTTLVLFVIATAAAIESIVS